MLLLAVWAGSITTSAAEAQTPSVDELDAAAAKAGAFLAKIHQQLLVYDRVLEMKVARGALTPEQAADQLRRRAEDLAKGTVTAKAQEDEEQQEAKLFFDAIDRAANGSPHWPALQSPAYYRALVGVILTRVRAEYADRVAAHLSTAQVLDDAYRALALTRGQEHLETTPFSNPDTRIFAAMDVPHPPTLPPVTLPPSGLEFHTVRPGPDISVVELTTDDPLECQSACEKNADCRAFSFTFATAAGGKSKCALKKSALAPRPDACCVSGLPPAATGPAQSPAPNGLAGNWSTADGRTVELKQNGNQVSWTTCCRAGHPNWTAEASGSIDGENLTGTFRWREGQAQGNGTFTYKLSGNKLEGTVTLAGAQPIISVMTRQVGATLAGNWSTPDGRTIEIKQNGNQVSWTSCCLPGHPNWTAEVSGVFDGATVTGTLHWREGQAEGNGTFIRKLNGNKLEGTVTLSGGKPIASVLTRQAGVTLAGNWRTEDGRVFKISQNGNQVSWDYHGGKGHEKLSGNVSGILDGAVVKGTYKNREGDVEDNGKVTLTLSGNRLEGTWASTTNPGRTGKYVLDRQDQPPTTAANPPPKPAPPGQHIALQTGVDRPGSDYQTLDLPAAEPEQCRDACEKDDRCRAFTYRNPGQGPTIRCWLKSAIPPPNPNPCCTSGIKAP